MYSKVVLRQILRFKEAYIKFFKPEPIDGALMIVVATIGLAANKKPPD